MNRLIFSYNNQINFIDFNEIIFIERLQNKTIIHSLNKKIETNESLTHIFEKLDQNTFFRIHRSYIVNINFIEKIVSCGQKSYKIIFKEVNEDALFSYDRYKEFKKSFIE
ncbi:MAG: LytTR family transcriptional regulator [Firmicutes bacterium]|nr:LytTR family transcriptional regulator [Bacillota bacterium]